MKLKILLFLTFLICQIAAAQRYNFKTFTTKEGLSNNYINNIEKDKKGFLWIGTANGLCRFDGNYFTKFYNIPKNKSSIADNNIQKIYADTKGNIWITHNLGLSRFVESNQTFENYTIASPNNTLIGFEITDDFEGNIWAASSIGLFILDRQKKEFIDVGWRTFLTHFFKDKDIVEKEVGVISVLKGHNHKLWLKTSNHLFEYDFTLKQFKAHPSVLLSSIIGGQIMHDDSIRQTLYIGSFNMGLTTYNYATQHAQNRRTNRDIFRSLANYDPFYNLSSLSDKAAIFRTDFNIGLWDKNKNTASLLLALPSGTQINGLVTQDSSDLWVGTTTGLIHVEKDNIDFHKIPDPQKVAQGAFSYIQKAGENASFYYHNALKNQVVIWDEKTGETHFLPLKNGFIKGFLRYVFYDKKGNTWLCTDFELFCKKTNAIVWQKVNINHPSKNGEPLSIRNLCHDGNGRLWLRVRNVGLYLFNEKTEIFDYQPLIPLSNGAAYSDMIFHPYKNVLLVDEENSALIYEINTAAADFKVSKYHLADEKTEVIHPQQMALDSMKMVWINDPRKGMIRYDPFKHTKKIFNVDEGLIFNICETARTDAQGNIWSCSTEGVTKIVAATGECINLDYPEFRFIHDIFCDKIGNVYLSTTQGVFKWQSKNSIRNDSKGVLYWDKMVVNNTAMSVTDETPVFSYDENDITIHFGYLDLKNDFLSSFEYKMQNDTAWHYLGNQHLLSFSQLSEGEYQLQLRKKNDPNSKNYIQTRWVIKPPFWRTWWFILIAISAIAALIYVVLKRRINTIQEQARIKQKLAETEMMALRAQMNPHFIFNCISSIDNFILNNDKENASAWLNKFAKLIRGVLDNSRNDVIPFWKDWEILRLYVELEHLRSDDKFTFTMTANPELLEGHYRIPPLIVQPFIENAIHHGLLQRFDKNGKLTISAFLTDNHLHFIIEDNGIGREKAQELKALNRLDHNSYGLKMSRDRIDLFNTHLENALQIHDLVDENGVATGTKVEIILIV